jgi:hypothetical protein
VRIEIAIIILSAVIYIHDYSAEATTKVQRYPVVRAISAASKVKEWAGHFASSPTDSIGFHSVFDITVSHQNICVSTI